MITKHGEYPNPTGIVSEHVLHRIEIQASLTAGQNIGEVKVIKIPSARLRWWSDS